MYKEILIGLAVYRHLLVVELQIMAYLLLEPVYSMVYMERWYVWVLRCIGNTL